MTIVAPALTALGFTTLEAEAYCALLSAGPATAYRISKLIARPTANTYQALAALLQQGAVLAGDGPTKVYRAVEPDMLLSVVDSRFAESRAAAAAALRGLPRQPFDERVYGIENVDQLIERARAVVAGAEEIILIDMFPAMVAQFESELASAAARGVLVAGLVYDDAEICGATLIRSALSPELIRRWPGEQLTIVADAHHYVTALLASDLSRLTAAFSSDSPFLACLQHSGLSAEIRLAAIRSGLGDTLEPISLLNAYPEGLTRLIGAPDRRGEGE